MGDVGDSSSANNDTATEEDQHYYDALQTHLQTFLPFLNQIIDNSEQLNILPNNVPKLRKLIKLVDGKRLSPKLRKTCQNIFYDLYKSYGNLLNYYLPPDFKTSWMQKNKLNDEEKNISSDVRCTSNKNNQNQNSESILSNKIPVPGTSYEKIVNNQMGCLEVLIPNKENTIDNNFENVKIGESSCSKNAINDLMLATNYLPKFSDSRLKLNKIISFETIASIEKLNKSDASNLHTVLTTHIFDEMIKQQNGSVTYKNMSKGINLDSIDINCVKEIINNVQRASCVDPILPPPLPTTDLLKLGASRIHLIPTTEPNSSEVTQDNVLLSKSSNIIPAQLNTDTNNLQKTDSSNKTKQKFISALKSITLIDLENSKVICTSSHIDSLGPVIKLNMKNTDIKTSVACISVPRDPRIRHKSLLSTQNNCSAFNIHTSLVPNKDNTNAIFFEVILDNVLLSKSSNIIRAQLNTDTNNLQKTGSSNQTKQNFISALKPTTLIDLENSKVICTSSHIDSLGPVIKSNMKNTDIKTSVACISVPRDPRIRHKSLLSTQNNCSAFNTPTSLVPNKNNTNATFFETRAQEMSVYNGQSSSSYTNTQMLNSQFSLKYNGNSIQLKNEPLSQNQKNYYRNNDKKIDFRQFNSSTQMHVNPFHTEPLTKYCDPVPYISHSNHVSKRDLRTLKSFKTTRYSNSKEYREVSKNRERNRIYAKNKNQMNQDENRLVNEKMGKKNFIGSFYDTFGFVNKTFNIKNFKIPKIKHNKALNDNSTVKDSKLKTFWDNKNNTDVLKAEKNSKIPLKSDTIKRQLLVDQKSELKKSNKSIEDANKTDQINDSRSNKDFNVEITKNSNTDRNIKIKRTIMNNKSKKDNNCQKMNVEEITVNSPSKVNKDELDSKSEQNIILMDHTNKNKPKQRKKYSKKKKIEKVVKVATENLNDDVCGLKRRTRSFMKKEKILKTLKPNYSKLKVVKDITATSCKILEFGECSKNLDNVLIPNLEDVSGQIEIGHDIISSPSKVQSVVENSTTTEILCKSQKENIVSSNKVYSTPDNNPKIKIKNIIEMLKNPNCMNMIKILLEDQNKLEKLNKLLDISDNNTKDEKLKKKNILIKEQLEISETKKIKRNQRKEKKNVGEKSSNKESKNEILNVISDNNNCNQEENIIKTKKKKSHLHKLNKGNIYCHSATDQHKLTSKNVYENVEIIKSKSNPESKELKIVIAKLNKNIKRSENYNSDISSIDKQTNNKPINIEKAQEIKSKKPFIGPSSVKLVRQKMEMQQNNSLNERDINNQLEFETKKVRNESKSIGCDKKEKLISGNLTTLMTDQQISLIRPLQNPKPFDDKINHNKSVEQNSNTSTFIVNKPVIRRKARISELEKLYADISDCKAVLNSSNKRQCRTNKQIDYVSKKKRMSNIEQLDLNNDKNNLIRRVGRPKNTKKNVIKSTIKLNTKKQFVKKSVANKTLSSVVKTSVFNKMSNKQPDELKKKNGYKKFKKSDGRQLRVALSDECELNNVLENKISTEITSKTVTENKLNDKLYFQTADNCLECKFCNYKDKGLNIVRHYKDQHCGTEVLPSRLPKNCTESLIQQSLKENFGYLNSQDSKPFCVRSVKFNYACVFCQVIFHDYVKFYDHITGHTGEYRYKCKKCDQVYSNADDLDKHTLEHTDYDKTDGISHLIFPNPVPGKYVFGYLCSFCYYVQLNYDNIVKHIASQHIDKDKKLNGHWTVIRISMSVEDKIYTDSPIDYDNLVGCLPPLQSDQVICKIEDSEDRTQQLTVIDLNVLQNEQKQSDFSFSIKKECNDENIDEISQESIINESSSELSIYENLPDLTIDTNSSELTINEDPPESNIDENLSESVIFVNPPVPAYDKTLPKSNMLKFSPDQANKSLTKETRISSEQLEIEFSEYTLKENSKKCVLAGLSCELINSMLLFKCSISNCLEIQYSTVVLIDFSKHINKNHQFVTWDGNCQACHHKIQIVSEEYYVRNALEHLVSHHLVLKNNKQHPNTTGSKTEGLSSLCQDKKSQSVEYSLRARCLPGDRLSIHNPGSSSISNIYDILYHKPLSDVTNSINENVNLNIKHGSNDERFLFMNSQPSDIKSLKKRKVKTSEINSSGSDNNDLHVWMKAKINCEVVLPNSGILIEAGLQIINNASRAINGTVGCLIDTTYTKDYISKVQNLPMNIMKTQSAFNEMSALPRLLGLFKCMDRTCTSIFSSKELFKLHMQLHFSNAEKKKENQIYNVQQFKMCAYCLKAFDDEESLANHIAEKYTFCKYFCPHCFYRAYTASHVLVHQSVVHTNISKTSIIKLEYDDGACEYPKEKLLVVNFKQFVLPYKCNIGWCGFSCYLYNEFIEHLNQEHQQCDQFCCYICGEKYYEEEFFAPRPTLMISHFKLHSLNEYQCIFCLFGSEIIDSMIEHLAFEHFEYEPLCLERCTISDNCESKNIKNLKILRLEKVIDIEMVEIVKLPVETISIPEILPRRSNKISIECPDVPPVAMKSTRMNKGSQPSDTVFNTVPDSALMAKSRTLTSLAVDNKFTMIDDKNQNDMKESLKITSNWSESKNIKNEHNVSSNNDIIVIDDEDNVVLSEKEEHNEVPTKRICLEIKKSITRPNYAKRSSFLIFELDKLFVCIECDKVFSNGDMYFAHLKVCPFWDYVAGRKCVHCDGVFKNALLMTEHIKLHGPDRFKCYLCNLKVPSLGAIKHHMKINHRIMNIDIVPEHPNLTDFNKDDFVVLEDKTVKQNIECEDNLYKITQEQSNNTNNSVHSLMTQQNTSLKRKNCFEDLFYSPNIMSSIPKLNVFPHPINCLLCTYNTKLRSKLIAHLNEHKIGQDNTTKKIINPVPSIGQSKQMFDNSASAFDAMNTKKIKRDELDEKIVEVAPDDSFHTDIFPQFIPKNILYKCPIPLCTFIGATYDLLKIHMSILHHIYQWYICAHCPSQCIISKVVEKNQIQFHLMHHGSNLYSCQYCDYIHFNRVEMRTHMKNAHLLEITNSVQSNIVVIRQTMEKDDSIDIVISKAPLDVPQWVCNLCSSGLRYTENEIIPHIVMAHKVSNMFKCLMCQFEHKDDNPKIFEEHYKLQHPSVAVKCLKVFEKITDNEDSCKQSKHLRGIENMLEQLQA